MSEQVKLVEQYMESYRRGNHVAVLACLSEDVVWDIPGFALRQGKAAFEDEFAQEGNDGPPEIEVSRYLESPGTVVAEGRVLQRRVDGSAVRLRFCDVFEFRQGLISRLTSYLADFQQL